MYNNKFNNSQNTKLLIDDIYKNLEYNNKIKYIFLSNEKQQIISRKRLLDDKQIDVYN